jgi:hypothetical protein
MQGMTDARKYAMAVLLDKVRTGTAIEADFGEALPNAKHSEHSNAWLAYIGSLDAAKALHDAVLQGWEVDAIWQHEHHQPRPRKWQCRLRNSTGFGRCVGDYYWAGEDNPARAWLLAILSALIEMEDGE